MHALKAHVDRVLGLFIAAMFAVMTVCVVWQVLSRYVLPTPSVVMESIARVLFIWVGLIGAAYTLGQRKHLAIDFLIQMTPLKTARLLALLVTALIAAFAAIVMVKGGMALVQRTLSSGQIVPVLNILMGYVYAAVPISGGLMLYYCADFAAGLITGRYAPVEDLDADASSGAEPGKG